MIRAFRVISILTALAPALIACSSDEGVARPVTFDAGTDASSDGANKGDTATADHKTPHDAASTDTPSH